MSFDNACRIIARWMIENDPAQTLDLSCNQLTRLPCLPVNVVRLNISYNNLTEFPDLPPSVRHIQCRYNRIAELECVPAHIDYLDISENHLAYKPYLLSENTTLVASVNPLIVRELRPAHSHYIMDMMYSESLVRTMLHGL
jgi:Leucine-rich repeat (LRR) protein